MPFYATNLVQNILTELAQVPPVIGMFDAIGGSATTFVAGTSSTGFGALENPPEQDFFKNYLAIVVRDAGGAGASPEGKWGVVSAYADATWTGTIPTVTDAIAVGDKIMLARQDKYPLSQILFAINQALQEVGDLPANADTSLTTSSSTEEYSIPVGVKRGLRQVWIQYTTNYWDQVFDKRNEPTAAGTAGKLYLPTTTAGLTIKLVYDGPHAVVSAYNSEINEYVHPTVITCASILKLLEWYNTQDANQDPNSYTLWLEGQYRDKRLPKALFDHPIYHAEKSARFFTKGQSDRRYSRISGDLLA